MRRSTLNALRLALCLAALPAAAVPAAPATPGPHQYSIEQFLNNVNWTGLSFSPDGKTLLASNDSTGVFNLYAVPAAGGAAVRLTDSKVSAVRGGQYFPDGVRILYESDRGGNEQTHLYVRNPDGSSRELTPGDKVKASFLGWAHDERSFFYSTTERDPHAFDVYEMPVDLGAPKMIFKNEQGFAPGGVSADRHYLALLKSGDSTEDSDVYVYDLVKQSLTCLSKHDGQVENTPVAFSPDSRSLYATTDAGNEFAYLVRYDLATGKSTEVLKPKWAVDGGRFSHDGHYFVVSVNADARTETHLYTMPEMREVALPAIPDVDVTVVTFSRDGRRLAFYGESSRQPRNLFVLDLSAAAGASPRELTHSLNAEIDPADLVVGKNVRFASYDGLSIPGILYQPHGASPTHRVPALVWVHGGPGGQSRISYNGTLQFLANHGYAIYAINNRGSGGYGKTFSSLDDRKHGEVDLDDCVASKGMLDSTGWVEPERIGILGGSYGGYMVLAALAFRPTAFVLGVDLFGVANWVRTLESIPPDWEPIRRALYKEMGDPQTDHDYLVRISPLFHTDQIVRPLIVLQGENDPRVLRRESDEIVAAVKARGIPVDYQLYPNEGHGFARKETTAKAYKAILAFLDAHLRDAAPGK